MKRNLLLLGISALAAWAVMGCSSTDTPAATTYKYAGSVTPGDFVHFERTGNTITYEVEGDVFGNVTGEVNVTDLTGDEYVFKGTVNGEETYFFTTGNIGMASIPINGVTYLGVGLREAATGLTADDVVGHYAYGEVDFNPTTHNPNGADGCLIDVKADQTADLTCMDGAEESGGWKISEDKTYLLYKANTAADDITEANADARVVVRPAEAGKPKGFLADLAGGKGFGIGLEQVAMTQDSVKGDYLAINYLDRKLLDVTVTPDANNTEQMTYTSQRANAAGLGTGDTGGGTIRINHDCDGNAHDGIACVTDNDGAQFVGSLDNGEGYFALIGEHNVIVGVAKPAQ